MRLHKCTTIYAFLSRGHVDRNWTIPGPYWAPCRGRGLCFIPVRRKGVAVPVFCVVLENLLHLKRRKILKRFSLHCKISKLRNISASKGRMTWVNGWTAIPVHVSSRSGDWLWSLLHGLSDILHPSNMRSCPSSKLDEHSKSHPLTCALPKTITGDSLLCAIVRRHFFSTCFIDLYRFIKWCKAIVHKRTRLDLTQIPSEVLPKNSSKLGLPPDPVSTTIFFGFWAWQMQSFRRPQAGSIGDMKEVNKFPELALEIGHEIYEIGHFQYFQQFSSPSLLACFGQLAKKHGRVQPSAPQCRPASYQQSAWRNGLPVRAFQALPEHFFWRKADRQSDSTIQHLPTSSNILVISCNRKLSIRFSLSAGVTFSVKFCSWGAEASPLTSFLVLACSLKTFLSTNKTQD